MPSPIKRVPHTNHLIEALPRIDRKHFLAGCESVGLAFNDIVCEPGDRIRYVYFPTDSFISHVSPIDGHAKLEVALVGNEGMHGIALVLGVNVAPLHALVQGAGTACSGEASTPRMREIPTMPSSPTNPTSRLARLSVVGVTREMILPVGK